MRQNVFVSIYPEGTSHFFAFQKYYFSIKRNFYCLDNLYLTNLADGLCIIPWV